MQRSEIGLDLPKEKKTAINVRWDNMLQMFIIKNDYETLQPACSLIDLLNLIYEQKYTISNMDNLVKSMGFSFTPLEFKLLEKHRETGLYI